jgi:hypothetical protein
VPKIFEQKIAIKKQEVLGRTNRLFFLIHQPHRKRRVQQFYYCVCIRCRNNVFAEPLPNNDMGIQIQTHRLMGGIYEVRRCNGFIFRPWRWRRHVPPKRLILNGLHGDISQKMQLLKFKHVTFHWRGDVYACSVLWHHEVYNLSCDFPNINTEVDSNSQPVFEPDTSRTRTKYDQQNKTFNVAIHLLEKCRKANEKLDLRFSQRWLWRVSSSGIWRRVVRRVSTDVSEEHIKNQQASLPPACLLFFAELISSTLKMEAICFSETSVETRRTTRRRMSEDDTLQMKSCPCA